MTSCANSRQLTLEILTDGHVGFWAVQRADDDETEALILLAVDHHIAGLCALGRRGFRSGATACGRHRGDGPVKVAGHGAGGKVAPGGAVLCGYRARAPAILRTGFTGRCH